MITIAKTNKLRDELEIIDNFANDSWVHLTNPSDVEVEKVIEACGIPEEMLKAPLDEEETAHYDSDDGTRMFIIDIPVIEQDDSWYVYTTLPFGIILTDRNIVTVTLKESTLVNDFLSERVRDVDTAQREKLLLQMFFRNAEKFSQQLRQIDKTSHRVQNELHKSMKNKELILLLELEKSLVYFSTALRSDAVMVDKLSKMDFVKANEDYSEYVDDIAIEYKQAIEMSNIYRDILSGTMDAFASIISNNVNIVMKLLTVITIVLTIPTLIASFWGMNVDVPLSNLGYWGFVIILGISALASGITAVVLINRTNKLK